MPENIMVNCKVRHGSALSFFYFDCNMMNNQDRKIKIE